MSDLPRFRVRFWGVRGSYPVPGASTLRYGGNTSCVEIEAGNRTLVLDAGSGIIALGEALMQRHHSQNSQGLTIALLITHAHGDHLLGLPFFSPLYEREAQIDFFGPRLAGRDVEQLVTSVMSPPYFPVDMRNLPSQRIFHTLEGESWIIWPPGARRPHLLRRGQRPAEALTACAEVCVHAKFTQQHPQDGSLLYAIEYAGQRLIYATDLEWREPYNSETLSFLRGADLLIHDAQYTPDDYYHDKRGFGHSTYEMAVKVTRLTGARELILFHHEPTYDDSKLERIEREARAGFERVRLAREGMEIDLLAPTGADGQADS